MMEVVSGDNWSCKTCKAAVISSLPTNQHQPDALPVAQPTDSVKEPKGKKDNISRTSHPKLPEILPTLFRNAIKTPGYFG